MDSKASLKQAAYWLLFGIFVFAPLFRAGNLPLPLMLLELSSLVLLGLAIWDGKGLLELKTSHLAFMLLMLMVPLVQLVPLPLSSWTWLPGRVGLLPILENLLGIDYEGFVSASIVPGHSESALWALVLPIAVYITAINQPTKNLTYLTYLLLAMAAFQAALSLMQYGNPALQFDNEWNMMGNAGTYLNKDHLAGFLEMMLPILLGLMAANIGAGQRMPRRLQTWRKKLSFLASGRGHKAVFFAAIAVLLVLALIFIRSRAGMALAMLGIFLALMAFSRRLGGSNLYGTYGTVLAVIVALAIEVGLAPVLDRFSVDLLKDLRWRIYDSSLEGVAAYFPIGSGPGTFPAVYPIFQPENMDVFVNHAHNDYLEWVFEGGILALGLIIIGWVMYLMRWRKVWLEGSWQAFRYIQVGAGIGLCLMMLHSFVDFNLHKPANSIYFAFLLAVFMRENIEEKLLASKSRRPHRTHHLPAVKEASNSLVTPSQKDPLLDNW